MNKLRKNRFDFFEVGFVYSAKFDSVDFAEIVFYAVVFFHSFAPKFAVLVIVLPSIILNACVGARNIKIKSQMFPANTDASRKRVFFLVLHAKKF